MDQKNISIKDFFYVLPTERIAKYPLPQRDESKLLIYKNGNIYEDIYLNLDAHLSKNSLLIFNDTKVIEARLLFEKSTGSVIELFCLEPDESYVDITSAMLQTQKIIWKCLAGGAKKWKEPVIKIIKKDSEEMILTAKKIKKTDDHFLVEFSWNDDSVSFAEILHLAGKIPLPPYLKRDVEETDKKNYQTIYAKYDGSVAAPTAGLHFTERLFEKLHSKKILKDFVTLHVGAGTFMPVKAETMRTHQMHSEFSEVKKELIENLLRHLNDDIIAVGTTSLRVIESLYWLGVKLIKEERMENGKFIASKEINLNQWEAYELPPNISPAQALENLLNWMEANKLQKISTKTQMIIVPGYQLKVAKAIITNFHQSQSTLLLLVAAIVGEDWKKIYKHALKNNFRFLSYGDGSLIWGS